MNTYSDHGAVAVPSSWLAPGLGELASERHFEPCMSRAVRPRQQAAAQAPVHFSSEASGFPKLTNEAKVTVAIQRKTDQTVSFESRTVVWHLLNESRMICRATAAALLHCHRRLSPTFSLLPTLLGGHRRHVRCPAYQSLLAQLAAPEHYISSISSWRTMDNTKKPQRAIPEPPQPSPSPFAVPGYRRRPAIRPSDRISIHHTTKEAVHGKKKSRCPASMSSSSSSHWLSLVGSVWLQTINGPNADFPVYSSQLKEIKGISQVQLNFLAFASDAGKLFGWFAGVAALYLPLWLVAVTGAAFGLVGYGVQFLFLEKSGLAYWHLFLLTSLAGNGICWINTVCYLLCIKNFPSDSRVVVSLATSYLGLSAKLYTTMAGTMPRALTSRYSTTKVYLLLNAVVPMAVTLVAAPSLRVVDLVKSAGKKKWSQQAPFLAMFVITLATGACAIVGSVGSASVGLSSRGHMVSLYVMLAMPLLIPVALKVRESLAKIREAKWENRRVHDHDSDGGAETAAAAVSVVEIQVEDSNKSLEEQEEQSVVGGGGQEEVGGLQLLKRIDFWLYFFSYLFSATLGLVFLNNLGQIAESRGLADASTLVSLSSSFGFFGRLLPAFLDYYTAK
ncbi:hypothetical protein PR202_gb01558 [Eleusine coracana subsp. coracana]|uniref:Nodulin-like domain-containing protein n=1 Tax=Eleusine coracana subsp. coracana TaxID=191504 RepID=A0AAV5DVY2_ELECO|nr:hypothetical protein PR202_gb01558 [Eleusine coracana subsp. coracana]